MPPGESESTVRFLGLLNQPEPDPSPDPLELDEGDVVWSSDISESSISPTATSSNSPTAAASDHRHGFRPKSGLSAALADNSLSSSASPVLRRKSTLNPTLSAASAARLIPPVPVIGSPARFLQSAPVNVPVWPKKAGGVTNFGGFDEIEEEDDEEEMVPPHVIVARSHVTTFSVFEGVGRTLKGRDLRRVRNAVFQKTGFVD